MSEVDRIASHSKQYLDPSTHAFPGEATKVGAPPPAGPGMEECATERRELFASDSRWTEIELPPHTIIHRFIRSKHRPAPIKISTRVVLHTNLHARNKVT
jgi:hypothetical protein